MLQKKITRVVCFVCFVCLSVSVTGCSYMDQVTTFSKDTIDVVSKASVIKGQYDTISFIIKKHREDFTDEELSQFANIDQNARMIYTKIKSLTDIKEFDVNPDELIYLYDVARDSYVRSKAIIEKHERKFDPIELAKLRMFDVQLKMMDIAVKKMLENPDTVKTRKALDTILKVASVSLKVVLPLVL